MLQRDSKVTITASLQHIPQCAVAANHKQISKFQKYCHIPVQHLFIGTESVSADGVSQYKRNLQTNHVKNDKVNVLYPSL